MTERADDLRTSIAAPLFDLTSPGYFTSMCGYTNARYVPFTDGAKHLYSQIFGILEHFGVDYYVFAGTLVGHARNGRMPYWMDDIDIMIFEADIPLFEEKVAPAMLACGFNCKVVGKHYGGGGYHILALQQAGTRDATIAFSDSKDISVPWAQFDVFFSNVDDDGFVRNLKNWGLYHRKDIPVEWVQPAQTVEMDGMSFPTFANIPDDVAKEYGDVMTEIVIQSHAKIFLRAGYVEWDLFDAEFKRIVNATVSPLPPSVTVPLLTAYAPQMDVVNTPASDASLDAIMLDILHTNAGEVALSGGEQIYWVMDIKRLLPHISVSVEMHSLPDVKRAAHLRQFIDTAKAKTPGVQKVYTAMIEALNGVLGDRTFPGARNLDEIL